MVMEILVHHQDFCRYGRKTEHGRKRKRNGWAPACLVPFFVCLHILCSQELGYRIKMSQTAVTVVVAVFITHALQLEENADMDAIQKHLC